MSTGRTSLAALVALAIFPGVAFAEEARKLDVSKGIIESSSFQLLKSTNVREPKNARVKPAVQPLIMRTEAQPDLSDLTKIRIEKTPLKLLKSTAPAAEPTVAQNATPAAKPVAETTPVLNTALPRADLTKFGIESLPTTLLKSSVGSLSKPKRRKATETTSHELKAARVDTTPTTRSDANDVALQPIVELQDVRRPDTTKFSIESAPTKILKLSGPRVPVLSAPISIKQPVDSIGPAAPVLEPTSPAREKRSSVSDLKKAEDKVQPGLVRWHANHRQALAAARVSGKPVLLFQMMGRLDDRFC